MFGTKKQLQLQQVEIGELTERLSKLEKRVLQVRRDASLQGMAKGLRKVVELPANKGDGSSAFVEDWETHLILMAKEASGVTVRELADRLCCPLHTARQFIGRGVKAHVIMADGTRAADGRGKPPTVYRLVGTGGKPLR